MSHPRPDWRVRGGQSCLSGFLIFLAKGLWTLKTSNVEKNYWSVKIFIICTFFYLLNTRLKAKLKMWRPVKVSIGCRLQLGLDSLQMLWRIHHKNFFQLCQQYKLHGIWIKPFHNTSSRKDFIFRGKNNKCVTVQILCPQWKDSKLF